MTTPRYICIHGHFYQPPRENPWIETIEPQPSAAPFRDWNERVHHECYAPNACARILGAVLNAVVERFGNYYYYRYHRDEPSEKTSLIGRSRSRSRHRKQA